MSFPNSNITDIIATTIELRSKTIADNVTAQNAVFNQLNKSGNVQTASGGTEIREHFSFAENTNAGSYSGYDTLPTAAQDVIGGAQYQWAQYAVPVVFSGREQLMNSGPQAIIDLIKNRVKVAENSLANVMNRHVYLDGTGNNGKNLTGLGAAVILAPTNTYGGIDRSVAANAFWKNLKFQASVDGTGVATSSTIQGYWTTLMWNLTRGTDMPNMIIAAPNVYSMFAASLQAIQRINSAEIGNAGFKSLEFMGVPVIYEPLAGGISTSIAYFLNTNYLHLRPHAERNVVPLDDKSSSNQDATVKTIAWMGNMTCSGAKFQGVFSNT
ncbi:MAG: phage major capsid protein [Candidatus Accumulibacter sp. UW25]|jgi:hypothetical protein